MSQEDGENSDVSYSSNGEAAEDEDPYDIKPEFSEEPPKDTVTFSLDTDEQLLFYQRSRFPIHACLAHTQSEVVITQRRVIITQADQLRGIKGHPGFPYRMRQHVISRDKVAGYDAGVVQPKCWHLVLGIVLLVVGTVVMAGGQHILVAGARWLHPVLWVRFLSGGACRHVGLCGIGGTSKADSLVQLSEAQFRRTAPLDSTVGEHRLDSRRHHAHVEQVADGRQHAELRPSGNLQRLREPSSRSDRFLVPSRSEDGPIRPQSLLATRNLHRLREPSNSELDEATGGQLNLNQSDAVPKAKKETSSCVDFPHWVDSDGGDCFMYSDYHWPLSCTSADTLGTEASHRFDARRDNTAFHLNALEACCICGGGQNAGRNAGVRRLVGSLWPMVVALSSSSAEASQISLAGQGVLSQTLRDISIADVTSAAKVVAQVQTNEIVAGVSEPSEDLSTLLKQLATNDRITQVTKSLADLPLLGPGTYALNLDTADLEGQTSNQQAVSIYATLAAIQPLTMCTIKFVFLILWLVGIGLITNWFLMQRTMDRIYVKLKVHKDYFGTKLDELEQQSPATNKANHKVEQYLGFFLPPSRKHPYRLREMAKALLAPHDHASPIKPGPRAHFATEA